MTASGIRDLGEILLRISSTFVGGLLLALAFDVEPGSLHAWGWVVAVAACPLAWAIRHYGETEMAVDAASNRQRVG